MLSCRACYHLVNDHDIAGCEICQCALSYPALARQVKEELMACGHLPSVSCPSCKPELYSQQPVPVQPTTTWYHRDGSVCPGWDDCDTYVHSLTPPTPEEIEGMMDELLEHEHTSQCRPPNVCPERSEGQPEYQKDSTGEWAMPIYAGPIGVEVPRDGNVGELIDGRIDVYGDPVTGFVRHAQVWSGILGYEVQPWQVALCMLGYKLVRTSITPDYSDNSDDIDGYKDIFITLMGDEMVHARDTAAYLAGGGKGARA